MEIRCVCRSFLVRFLTVLVIVAVVSPGHADRKRPLTFADIMRFRAIHDPVISEDGRWLAYEARPDRGDGEVVIQALEEERRFRIERGRQPLFSRNARWVAVRIEPPAVEKEVAAGKDEPPRPGLRLLNTVSGAVFEAEKIKAYRFSNDSRWIAFQGFPEKPADEKSPRPLGGLLVIKALTSGWIDSVGFATEFAFDSLSRYLAVVVSDSGGRENGLYLYRLQSDRVVRDTLLREAQAYFSGLTWDHRAGRLAFLKSRLDEEGLPGGAQLMLWSAAQDSLQVLVDTADYPDRMVLPPHGAPQWSKDGRRLFLGFQPEWLFRRNRALSKFQKDTLSKAERAKRFFDIAAILKKRGVDVWHWNDPRILPHQKREWEKERRRTYRAVYHMDNQRVVLLADSLLPVVEVPRNARIALGFSDVPYLKEITWEGWWFDVYVVDLRTGRRTLVAERLSRTASLSPEGNYLVYYRDRHWHLYDVARGTHVNLTATLGVPFFNEDHDYPYPPPGYGVAGWVKGDRAVLIYDKYDIWQVPTDGGRPVRITGGEGRRNHLIFRIIPWDTEKPFFQSGETLLLYGYHDVKKYRGFYRATIGKTEVQTLLQEKKRFTFLAKAGSVDRVIFTRESYEEFPDIWVSDWHFKRPRKVTRVNPQMEEFLWGRARLVEWRSEDGLPLQGVVILPENYQPGRRYPVLVYFYRFFSQRLYEFNQPVINHRPCFPLYTSNGYVIFLPDIRFEVGRPGYSALKCLVPGVQKLIDLGIADPDAIALHGHSWSGYQTAFVITQTHLFTCAIAGAPVSNMTSAYSGIRWGSGLARQFQYEKFQSRIGGSLWEYPERYFLNSPVFFAHQIRTPLLIMFGDQDEAVPWYQGIELYLALRRLGKESVFLQYRGEKHHLQTYANKLDYAIKMKQYLDHYLKGAPAPAWLSEGVPYRGE